MLRVLAVVVVVASVGCGSRDREEDPVAREAAKVTPTTEYDASKGFIDEDYRFEVKSPGSGWTVMRESDARHINVDAIAAVSRSTVQAVAIVESLPGTKLDAYADLIVSNMKLEDRRDERENITFSGLPAMRIDLEGKLNDLHVRYRMVLLTYQDHGYQFLAFSPGRASLDDLDRALSAFSIVPGTVKGRRSSVVIEDQIGIGWWIDDGVFASAATRLRVKPPKGWRLMVDEELHKSNADAEIGLAGTEFNMYAAVVSEPIGGSDEKAYLAARAATALSEMTPVDDEPPVKAVILGREIVLTRAVMKAAPLEFLFGIVIDDQRAYQVLGWYPAAQRKAVEAHVLTALGSLELMPKAAAEKLALQLSSQHDRQNDVGANYALRDGTFYDYTHRIRWKKPSGFWAIHSGQAARAGNSDALLQADEPASGLFTQIIVEAAAGWSGDTYHATIEKSLVTSGFKSERRGPAAIAGRPGRMTEGMLTVEGSTMRYRLATAIVDGTAVQLSIWGAPGGWPGEARLTEITSAVSIVADQRPTRQDGDLYTDHRLGYRVELPWRREDITPKEIRAIASGSQWTKGGAQIIALAVYTLDKRDDAWFLDLIEQLLRRQFAGVARDKPKTTTSKLDGLKARHITWTGKRERVDALLIHRDKTFYLLGTLDDLGTADATLERARAAFHLLP